MPEETDLIQFFDIEPEIYSHHDGLWKVKYFTSNEIISISHSIFERSFQITVEMTSGGSLLSSFEGLNKITLHDSGSQKYISAMGDLQGAIIETRVIIKPVLEVFNGILAK